MHGDNVPCDASIDVHVTVRRIPASVQVFMPHVHAVGYIILVHHHTKQWVANLKMNGTVHAAAFTSDGGQLYAIGGE